MSGLITGWSATKLSDYETCPRFAKYKHVDRLCPLCFKGSVRGEFGGPYFCDACGEEIKDPAPMARGSEIGANLEKFVNGEAKKLHPEVKHPKIVALAKTYRKEFTKGRVKVELPIILDANWRPVSKYTKGAWFRGKLDVYRQVTAKEAEVIDWKTGGIDKRTGDVKASEKYDDQLSIYALIALVQFPTVLSVSASLAFVDCGSRFNPIVERKACNLDRSMIAKEQKRWTGRVKALLSDRIMAPKANYTCTYCAFSKAKGGPCPY